MYQYDDLQYLSVPLPEDLQKLKGFGDFERMNRVIDLKMKNKNLPEALKKRLVLEKEIIRLYPLEYPYDTEAALAQMREVFGSFDAQELEQLRDQDVVEWAYIGGVVMYKDDLLRNLIKTRKVYEERILPEKRADYAPHSKKALDDAIRTMIEKGELNMRFRVRETLRVENAEKDKEMSVWLPIPKEYAQSKNLRILSLSHPDAVISPSEEPQRTVYFRGIYDENNPFSVEYTFETHNKYVNPDSDKVSEDQPSFDTEEQAPHILFTPYLKMLAKEIVGDETNPLIKARKIYDFITTKSIYSFMRAYLTIPMVSEYMATSLKGDCGVQALLFITLCRICGIPARWQSGIDIQPGDVGSHDWAQFYVAPYGWLFANTSFGGSAYRSGSMMRWNFYFGNLEPYRVPANSEYQRDFMIPPKHLRHDPYDNQCGEAEYDDAPIPRTQITCEREVLDYTVI